MYRLPVLEARSPKSRGRQGQAPREGSRGGLFLPLPAPGGGWHSAVVPGSWPRPSGLGP